jgi:outer membrane murein-binding lipoprotein Lpp
MSNETKRIEALESEVRELKSQVANLVRIVDGFADTLRPRKFDAGQVRLDKFSGERHG